MLNFKGIRQCAGATKQLPEAWDLPRGVVNIYLDTKSGEVFGNFRPSENNFVVFDNKAIIIVMQATSPTTMAEIKTAIERKLKI